MGAPMEQCGGAVAGSHFCSNYNGYSTPEEYGPALAQAGQNHDPARCTKVPQPVWIEENAYAGQATPFREKWDAIDAGVWTRPWSCVRAGGFVILPTADGRTF